MTFLVERFTSFIFCVRHFSPKLIFVEDTVGKQFEPGARVWDELGFVAGDPLSVFILELGRGLPERFGPIGGLGFSELYPCEVSEGSLWLDRDIIHDDIVDIDSCRG